MKGLPKGMDGLKNYLFDRQFSHDRTIRLAKLSVLVNALIAIGKIGIGVHSLSGFLCVNGLYNVGIGSAKAVAIKGYEDGGKCSGWSRPDGTRKEENRCYLLVGIIVSLASLMYLLYSIFTLSGTWSKLICTNVMIVAIAVFTGIEITVSLRGMITQRRNKKPIMEAIKLTNFVSSLISLVLTQGAIASRAGTGGRPYINMQGIVLGSLSVCVGLYMIIYMCIIIRDNRKIERKTL